MSACGRVLHDGDCECHLDGIVLDDLTRESEKKRLCIDAEIRCAMDSVLLPAQKLSREARIRIVAAMMIMFDIENDVIQRLRRIPR